MVFLSARMNGNEDSNLTQFTERDGQLYLSRESAAGLGFSAEFLNTVSADTPLSAYPGVEAKYDRSLQSVEITAPFSILDLDTTVVGRLSELSTVASVSPGILLNYDLYSSYTNHDDVSLSGFTELRAFNNWGSISNSYLMQGQRLSNEPSWQRTSVRMDTTLEHSWQDQQITFRLGDTLTNGLAWTRQTRIGGLQVARNFTLQPYQSTTPVPAYFGLATLPSSVELYVNGMQQYNGQVPAGPFELNAMPSVNGAGEAQVVMTDALGRRTLINFPFYSATRLLRSGLTDWSFETGYVRKNYGYQSFDYSDEPMASGTIRHGFSNFLTAEGHLEGSQGIASGGLGVAATLGTLGTVSGAWAQSSAQGLTGKLYALGYQYQNRRFNFGGGIQRSDHNFRDVASAYGSTPTIRNDNAFVGIDAGALGSFGVNYAYLQQVNQPRYRFAGASWSRSFDHGISLSLSANQNLDSRSDRSFYLNLSISLDKGLLAYGSASQAKGSTSYSAGVSHTSPTEHGWNWSVQAQQSEQQSPTASAQASTRSQYFDFNLGANGAGSEQNAYAGLSGSLVAIGGGVFAARRIYDGFAMVSTEGVPDVPVKNQNRLMGKTDSGGRLLVPSLLSYQHNKISIDPTELPIDMYIERVEQDVVPRYGSGVNVTFEMERIQAATLILHRPDGKNIPMGAQAFLNGAQQPSGWVGYDGRLYLDKLKTDNTLIVIDDTVPCTVRFPYHAVPDTLPEIGPLSCTH